MIVPFFNTDKLKQLHYIKGRTTQYIAYHTIYMFQYELKLPNCFF